MITTTTQSIEGRTIVEYFGVVSAETIYGANVFRDLLAGVRNVVGGRSEAYENVFRDARETAMRELIERARALGANAVVGIAFDHETVGQSMLMVSVSGTAVLYR